MTVDFAKEYLLDDCEDCPENENGECMTKSHCFEVKRMAIQALEQTRWIPASEEEPERDGRYLVTFKNHFIYMAFYAFDLYEADAYAFENKRGISGWYGYDEEYGYYEHDDVIAWMPLPQPYKAESEDKE